MKSAYLGSGDRSTNFTLWRLYIDHTVFGENGRNGACTDVTVVFFRSTVKIKVSRMFRFEMAIRIKLQLYQRCHELSNETSGKPVFWSEAPN